MVRVVHFNGKTVPAEVRKLPAGDYVIAEYHPRRLTAEEERGIARARRSLEGGLGEPWEKVRARLDRTVARGAARKKKRTRTRRR